MKVTLIVIWKIMSVNFPLFLFLYFPICVIFKTLYLEFLKINLKFHINYIVI